MSSDGFNNTNLDAECTIDDLMQLRPVALQAFGMASLSDSAQFSFDEQVVLGDCQRRGRDLCVVREVHQHHSGEELIFEVLCIGRLCGSWSLNGLLSFSVMELLSVTRAL